MWVLRILGRPHPRLLHARLLGRLHPWLLGRLKWLLHTRLRLKWLLHTGLLRKLLHSGLLRRLKWLLHARLLLKWLLHTWLWLKLLLLHTRLWILLLHARHVLRLSLGALITEKHAIRCIGHTWTLHPAAWLHLRFTGAGLPCFTSLFALLFTLIR